MGFHEIQLPTGLSYGSLGGPGYSTSVVETKGGESFRKPRWSNAKRRYDIRKLVQTQAQAVALRTFYLARDGIANGWRFKDWEDYTTGTDDVGAVSDTDYIIGTGDGSETDFQLVKQYTSGSETKTRVLQKPVAGTVVVSIDDVGQASGWSVDTTTGIVTFTAAPALGEVVKAGCEFDVPAEFAEALDEALAHAVDEFDVRNFPSIPIVERNADVAIPGMYYHGGGSLQAPSATTVLNPAMGKSISVQPQSAGVILRTPSKTDLPYGGPHYVLKNDHGSNDFALKEGATTLVASVAAGEGVELHLYPDSGTKAWLVIGP